MVVAVEEEAAAEEVVVVVAVESVLLWLEVVDLLSSAASLQEEYRNSGLLDPAPLVRFYYLVIKTMCLTFTINGYFFARICMGLQCNLDLFTMVIF